MIYELIDTWLNISALWYWNDAYSLTRNRDGTNSWNWCCFRPFFHHFSSLGFPLLGTGFSLAPPPAAEPSFVGPSPNPLAVPWASIDWLVLLGTVSSCIFPLFSHSRNFRTDLWSHGSHPRCCHQSQSLSRAFWAPMWLRSCFACVRQLRHQCMIEINWTCWTRQGACKLYLML